MNRSVIVAATTPIARNSQRPRSVKTQILLESMDDDEECEVHVEGVQDRSMSSHAKNGSSAGKSSVGDSFVFTKH